MGAKRRIRIKFMALANVITFFLCGCSGYQYMHISGSLPQNNLKEFSLETDTVSIRYNFSPKNLGTIVSIENKLRQPLYIDYGRSVIIVNNEQLDQPVFAENQPGFIAPLSQVKLHNVSIRYSPIKTVEDTQQSKEPDGSPGRGNTYTESDSPLHFRHVLAITTNEDYSNPTFHDYSFWVSDIIETHTRQKNTSPPQGDLTYLKKNLKSGEAVIWTGIIAVTIIPLIVLFAALGG
jgi:hypothetical protein